MFNRHRVGHKTSCRKWRFLRGSMGDTYIPRRKESWSPHSLEDVAGAARFYEKLFRLRAISDFGGIQESLFDSVDGERVAV